MKEIICPTSLTEQQVREFQFLYYQNYNIKLTQEEAEDKGVRFLQFMVAELEAGQNMEKEKPHEI